MNYTDKLKHTIYCSKTNKYYWDNGFIRTFEKVILSNVTWEEYKLLS